MVIISDLALKLTRSSWAIHHQQLVNILLTLLQLGLSVLGIHFIFKKIRQKRHSTPLSFLPPNALDAASNILAVKANADSLSLLTGILTGHFLNLANTVSIETYLAGAQVTFF